MPLRLARETNSSVESRQQPTTRSGGSRFLASADSPRLSSSANIASAYRVSISPARSAGTPFSAQSPSAR
jgi:hypothetical protein